METTPAAHVNNLFPTAQGDAPDLEEERPPQSAPSTGFPAAPILKPGSIAAEIAHLAASPLPVVRTGTKIDQALAYLATCPDQTSQRLPLAAALGIDAKDLVAYLKSALTDGRITRLGNLFSVGVEPASRPTKRVRAGAQKEPKPKEPIVAPAPRAPVIEPAVVHVLEAPAEEKKATPEYLPIANLSVSGFSMAVWAAGATTIRAAGAAVNLSRAQMGVLQMFLELTESSGPESA